jgi:hypothetical protein
MITAYQIRRSDIRTKLFFILAPVLAITGFFSALMPQIIDSIYSNFIFGAVDTIHAAPPDFSAVGIPAGDLIVFGFCLIFFGAWLGSTKIEDL